MAKNTSVILGDHFDAFVGKQVGSGRYGSASEVLRAGLRLLEEREEQRAQRKLLDSVLEPKSLVQRRAESAQNASL